MCSLVSLNIGTASLPSTAMAPKQMKRPSAARPKSRTARKAAKAEGVVPRAARPFALFVKKNSRLPKGSGKADYQDELRRLGTEWRSLSSADKDQYSQQSLKQFERQRRSYRAAGFSVRRPQCPSNADPGLREGPEEEDKVCEAGASDGSISFAFPGYFTIGTLGSGGHSTVMSVVCKETGRRCALKMFKNSHGAEDDMRVEVLIYERLAAEASPAQQALFPLFLGAHAADPYPYMILEQWGETVSDMVLRTGGRQDVCAHAIALQVRCAVRCLHSLKILHLDISAKNVLWLEGAQAAKLTDMGMAESLENPKVRFEMYTTEPYRPPEFFHAEGDLSQVMTPGCDIWSYGILLHHVTAGDYLMRPLRRQSSFSETIRQWMVSHRLLGQQSLQVVESGARLQARLQMSGVFGPCILRACAPKPKDPVLPDHGDFHFTN